MNIILLKDIEKVGQKHTVVKVKDGYGRNYLIPQGLALLANASNIGRLDDLKRRESRMLDKLKGEAEAIVARLSGVVLKIGAKAGTSGKIFGSVTAIQISNALKDQAGIEADRKAIQIEEEVKDLGTYTAILDLHPEVKATINFEVIGE